MGDFKTHGAENGLDALECQRYRVQAALPALTAGQRYIECFSCQLSLQLRIGQRLSACIQGRFDRLLGQVDGGALTFLLLNGKACHALHQFRDAPRFAKKQGFRVFQVRRGQGLTESGLCAFNNRVQLVHKFSYLCEIT